MVQLLFLRRQALGDLVTATVHSWVAGLHTCECTFSLRSGRGLPIWSMRERRIRVQTDAEEGSFEPGQCSRTSSENSGSCRPHEWFNLVCHDWEWGAVGGPVASSTCRGGTRNSDVAYKHAAIQTVLLGWLGPQMNCLTAPIPEEFVHCCLSRMDVAK